MNTNPSSSPLSLGPGYLLLLRGPQGEPESPPEKLAGLMAWLRDLRERGLLKYTTPLEKNIAQVVSHPGGHGGLRLTDGPFAESKEVVGGIIILAARDFAHAVEVAAEYQKIATACCTTIEVRELSPLDGRLHPA